MIIKCKSCGLDTEAKSKRKKYCSNGCKQDAYNKRHGIKPFIKTSSKKKSAPILNGFEFTTNDNELTKLYNDREYWINVNSNAHKNIFPIGTILGAGVGAYNGETAGEKILLALVGGAIGNTIDSITSESRKNRKRNLIRQSNENIKRLDKEIEIHFQLKGTIQEVEQRGLINISNNSIKPTSKAFDRFVNAKNYTSDGIREVKLLGKWKNFLGVPQQGFSMMIFGPPKSGKSTFAVELANYLHNDFGDLLYIASEQSGRHKQLASLLESFNCKFDLDTKPNKNIKLNKRYDFVVIDSINHLGINAIEIEALKNKYPFTSFILLVQVTKDNKFKGSQELEHNQDIIIEIKNGVAYQRGRFNAYSEMKLFDVGGILDRALNQ